MNNKIYDAKALLATMSKRKSQYEETRKQIEALKKEFNEIVKMSEFQGKGAEAIKGFYQAQADVADAWDSFFDMQITFLGEISGTMEDGDLHGETVVTVPFLEQNVANGITSSEKMVNKQHDDLKKIFKRIQDIIVLEAFSKETFEEHIGEAEKERKETVKQVDLLDTNLQTEYAITEQHEANISTLFSKLLQATAQGGEVSPIHFDSNAYKASEIYQIQDELKQQSLDYINYKEEQAENRKLLKEIEEKENRPWYKKALDTTSTFVAEVTGYNDMRRAAEGVDPVTKEKLSEAERIAAGAMAAAGFIPVVGWVGRAGKGGYALYKTAKGVNAATHALDAYKTSKAFSILEKSEMGLYGLVAANGFGEYFTGKDMFGNELTEEQKQQGLMTGLMVGGTAGAARIIDKGVPNLPYSKEYVQQQIQKGQAILKDMGRASYRQLEQIKEGGKKAAEVIGREIKKVDLFPIIRVRESVATNGLVSSRTYGVETIKVEDVIQRFKRDNFDSRIDERTGNGGSGSNNLDNVSKEIKTLDKEIERLKKEGNDKEVKRLTRERNKLVNKLDMKDDISDHYDLEAAKEYERKIDNSKYFSHDKGDFGEEVTKVVARDSNLGQDVSDLFQVGRNGIDAAFLSEGPPPKLTIIESKASDSATFSYSDKQKMGGDKYFQGMVNSGDPRYASFGDNLEELMEENPGLQLDFIRVETDIKITDTGFGVDELKVKDWNKEID